ncbi:MAG: hypothetical protein R3F37_02430 [Candidatus Competibacteraceae bacterium]
MMRNCARVLEALRQIFDDATMVKASGKTIHNQALSKEAAEHYFKQLTTESATITQPTGSWPSNPQSGPLSVHLTIFPISQTRR